jgi:hypothetical protein
VEARNIHNGVGPRNVGVGVRKTGVTEGVNVIVKVGRRVGDIYGAGRLGKIIDLPRKRPPIMTTAITSRDKIRTAGLSHPLIFSFGSWE